MVDDRSWSYPKVSQFPNWLAETWFVAVIARRRRHIIVEPRLAEERVAASRGCEFEPLPFTSGCDSNDGATVDLANHISADANRRTVLANDSSCCIVSQ